MATKSNFATLVLVVATAVALLEGTAATVYFVGDSLGWTVPTGGATVYANWSSQHSFTTGDILALPGRPKAIRLCLLHLSKFGASITANHLSLSLSLSLSPSMAPSPTPSATTSPPPQSPATSPSPPPSATPPASTTSPPPPPATASSPSPPSETTLAPPPPPPNSAPLKAVAATLTIMFIALGVIF
ncbi:hypothetical protein Acr_13g0011290 [Actinidia rufa]|uniref:Phytocyanin domain-containing protein n=1 Tax=Actinidia rufa TaxID=165716 RepID=A0A7J0FNK0_9ERIC|nr:hypothetical protein Acr_13g0011290 [Actinidia rufa]